MYHILVWFIIYYEKWNLFLKITRTLLNARFTAEGLTIQTTHTPSRAFCPILLRAVAAKQQQVMFLITNARARVV